MKLLCRRCASRMFPVSDRDALECELCGHEVTGLDMAGRAAWRVWLGLVLGV